MSLSSLTKKGYTLEPAYSGHHSEMEKNLGIGQILKKLIIKPFQSGHSKEDTP